jgi:hypothetical protein
MTESETPGPLIEQKLRDVLEGQILALAGSSFAILAKHRSHRLVHLDLEADDGSPATTDRRSPRPFQTPPHTDGPGPASP